MKLWNAIIIDKEQSCVCVCIYIYERKVQYSNKDSKCSHYRRFIEIRQISRGNLQVLNNFWICMLVLN